MCFSCQRRALAMDWLWGLVSVRRSAVWVAREVGFTVGGRMGCMFVARRERGKHGNYKNTIPLFNRDKYNNYTTTEMA